MTTLPMALLAPLLTSVWTATNLRPCCSFAIPTQQRPTAAFPRTPHTRRFKEYDTIREAPCDLDAALLDAATPSDALQDEDTGIALPTTAESYHLSGSPSWPGSDGESDELGKTGTIRRGGEDSSRKHLGRRRRAAKRAARTVFKSIKESAGDGIFHEIDADGDGLLSKRELEQYFCQKGELGMESSTSSSVLFSDAIFDKLDLDGDGMFTRDEVSRSVGLNLDDREFSALDTDRDGFVNKEEFNRASLSSDAMDTEDSILGGIEDTLGYLEPLERQQFRLDGFDPYILVSVLTAQGSFDAITECQVDWVRLASETSLASLTAEDWVASALLVTAASSTLIGVYAAVVFSLSVLYGRTALGMERDEEYYAFLNRTGSQRFRAFQAFTISLALFCVVVVIEMLQKSPSVLQCPIAVAAAIFLFIATKEYTFITDAAVPIFAKVNLDTSDNVREPDAGSVPSS